MDPLHFLIDLNFPLCWSNQATSQAFWRKNVKCIRRDGGSSKRRSNELNVPENGWCYIQIYYVKWISVNSLFLFVVKSEAAALAVKELDENAVIPSETQLAESLTEALKSMKEGSGLLHEPVPADGLSGMFSAMNLDEVSVYIFVFYHLSAAFRPFTILFFISLFLFRIEIFDISKAMANFHNNYRIFP